MSMKFKRAACIELASEFWTPGVPRDARHLNYKAGPTSAGLHPSWTSSLLLTVGATSEFGHKARGQHPAKSQDSSPRRAGQTQKNTHSYRDFKERHFHR
jgi:hypothetical protein